MNLAALSGAFVRFFRSKLCLLVIGCTIGTTVMAQNSQSNIRFRNFSTAADTLSLDSLSVIPGTVVVSYAAGLVDTNAYTIKAYESKLIWKKKPVGDSVRIFFRVYPFALTGETHHKSYNDYKNYSINSLAHPFIYSPDEVKGSLIDFGSLNYNGSFSRSVSFGSSQDVVLNSFFNLQLSGMLTKDLEITAAITDNNIPIQPEGNTQQLQEFDKIFIQLRKDQHKVIVGDFDLAAPSTDHFLKFTRKYQGGFYSGAFNIKKVGVLHTAVGGGIARGKFARNTLTVVEGNQGPYKLLGTNGETLITILANSEQVFINGMKMDRGTDRDYTIDYNVGEITFMPRRIVSKDLRIVVEFQYSNNDYNRSAAYLATELNMKKADVRFNVFSEQDAKEQNVQQNLDANKKLFLGTIGDSIQKALYSGVTAIPFDPNRILYARIDTLIAGAADSNIYVYATDSTVAKYAVSFSLVGDGLGDYVPSTTTANGRVYAWVAPVIGSDGKPHPTGSYRPVIFIVTPKYQQMFTLGTDYRINKNNVLSTEVAMSNADPNMFSTKDNDKHIGFAGHVNYKGTATTKKDTTGVKRQQLVYDVDYEFIQNRFTTIERFRNVEFARDWNLGSLSDQSYNQHLTIGNIGYVWGNTATINYRFKTLLQDTAYQGYENALNGTFSKNGFNLIFFGSYLHSNSLINKTDYIRPKADFSYSIKKLRGWKVGTSFDHEINMIKNRTGPDTLTSGSYVWQNYKAYIGTPDSAKNKYLVEFTMRYEQRALGRSFQSPYYAAQGVNFVGSITTIKNQTLNFNLSYRHAVNQDSLATSDQPEHYYLGRVDYSLTAVRGVFRFNTLYELGTGRQQKLQEVYQASPNNTGDFYWQDNNSNHLKEIGEFYSRTPGDFSHDTTYIKVIIPTPEFVSVNTNQFNQVININPAAVWKSKEDFRKVIALFSLFASVQITKKTYAGKDKSFASYFNPIPLASEDKQLVATLINSRNSLYFNRLNAKYGGQIDFNYSRSRTLLTSGFENHFTQSQGALARWNVFKAFSTQFIYTNGRKGNQSDYYTNQKYNFTYNDFNADISYQFGTLLRLDLKYDFSMKINPNDSVGKQTGQVNKLTFEARYNTLKKNTLNASVSYASIQYNDKGYVNQQLQYAMLEGLQNKNNLLWSVGYSQNLTANIQMTLSYDGRMTGFSSEDKSSLKPIHTGRAEIRALF